MFCLFILYWTYTWNLSHSAGFLFAGLIIPLAFWFYEIPFANFLSQFLSEWGPVQKVPSRFISWKVPLMFSSRDISISGFTLRYWIHLELIFVQGDRYRPQFTLLRMWTPSFPSTICWRCCLSSGVQFLAFLPSRGGQRLWTLRFGPSVFFFWSARLFLIQHHAGFFFCSSVT